MIPGHFSDVMQFKTNNNWIVKEFRRYDDLYLFRKQIKSEDDILRVHGRRLNTFIPEHHLIFGTNDKGEKIGFIAMRKVIGEDLSRMNTVSKELVGQLEDTLSAAVELYRLTAEALGNGYFPDLFPPQEDMTVRFGNMMWGKVEDKLGLYTVDTFPLLSMSDAENISRRLVLAVKSFESEKGVKISPEFVEKITRELIEIDKNHKRGR
ncbi:TPA: hypothetical protein DIU27_05355 [Candidatus Collierbacteria bacterium]|nr:hypothetical protein [Candidatus Collierbacteria bacterium]